MLHAAVGQVRWVYHTAATVRDCHITQADDKVHYHVVGQVVEANTFMLEARPLVFVLELAGGHTWRWPIESCAINDEDGHGIVFRGWLGPTLTRE